MTTMSKAPEGILLYEQANDARRRGDHALYNSIIEQLIAYNARVAASKTGGAS